MVLFVAGLWFLNLLISAWNAYTSGKNWHLVKGNAVSVVLLGSALVMAACGFTWCFTLLLAVIGHAIGKIDAQAVTVMIDLAWIMIIIPVVASGFVITVNSIAVAAQKRDPLSIGIAGWNVFAQVMNTISLVRHMPDALGSVGSLFKSKSTRGTSASPLIIVGLVLLALFGGLIVTALIFEQGRKEIKQAQRAYARAYRLGDDGLPTLP